VHDIQTPYTLAKIRDLNNAFRRSFCGGVVVLTRNLVNLDQNKVAVILNEVRTFNAFNEKNDPYAENDFATFEVEGLHCFFKIDYFDKSMEMHSPDPSNPSVTKRCLTVGLAEDY
jgi:hypothetical protein